MIWHSCESLKKKKKKDKADWANFSFWAGREFFELHSARWSYLYDSHKSLVSSTLNSLQELKQDAAMENRNFFAAHHSFVLPPELEQIQVIKGLIFCRNCPWLKIHSCRKTNCQCREKKLPFVRIEFIPAQISGEVQCWFWPWIFMFSKTPHDCKISSTISLRNQFPLLACSCLLNVPQVDPAAAIHGSSVSLFGWARFFSKSLSCRHAWKTFGNLNWKLLQISPHD